MFSYNHELQFAMEQRPFSSNLDFYSSPSTLFPFSPLAFNLQDCNPFQELLSPQLVTVDAHHPPSPAAAAPPAQPSKDMAAPAAPKKMNSSNSRKRATRKDRHSKVLTLHGPRDRRMRLNLEVAPQFFEVQDLLGYDKASKTVQWLIKEAQASIDKLKAATGALAAQCLSAGGSSKSTEASTLELELEREDISTVTDCKGKASTDQQGNLTVPKAKRAGRRPSKRTAHRYPVAKESRAMARARARERAEEKKKKKKNDNSEVVRGEWNHPLLLTSIPLEGIDEGSGSHDLKSSSDPGAEVEEQCSPSTNHQPKQLNNNGIVNNEMPVVLLDYENAVCSNDTANFFPAEEWPNQFATIEGTRLW